MSESTIPYIFEVGLSVLFGILTLCVFVPILIFLSPFALIGYLLGIKLKENVEEAW